MSPCLINSCWISARGINKGNENTKSARAARNSRKKHTGSDRYEPETVLQHEDSSRNKQRRSVCARGYITLRYHFLLIIIMTDYITVTATGNHPRWCGNDQYSDTELFIDFHMINHSRWQTDRHVRARRDTEPHTHLRHGRFPHDSTRPAHSLPTGATTSSADLYIS